MRIVHYYIISEEINVHPLFLSKSEINFKLSILDSI